MSTPVGREKARDDSRMLHRAANALKCFADVLYESGPDSFVSDYATGLCRWTPDGLRELSSALHAFAITLNTPHPIEMEGR